MVSGKKRSAKKKRAPAANSGAKKRGAGTKARAAADDEGGARRAGLPAQDSVIAETTLRSPKGNVYRILKTDERDDYDTPAPTKDVRRRR